MKGYILRGVIYTALAMLAAFGGWINDLTPDKLPELTWLDWCKMAITVVAAGLIALRAHIDGSAERAREAAAEPKKEPANG